MPRTTHRLRRRQAAESHPTPITPALARRLKALLTAAGEAHLAESLDQLRVVEPCHCGNPRCASFYTVAAPETRWLSGREARTIGLAPGTAVDVVDGLIVAVELIRPDEG